VYMLTLLGFLARQHLRRLSASDASSEVVELARANLALLTDAGLRARGEALRALFTAPAKPAKRRAGKCATIAVALSAGRARPRDQSICGRRWKVGELQDGLQGNPVDIVIADVPHGDLSRWRGSVLDAMLLVTHNKSVIAVMTLKHTDVTHPGLHLIRRLRRGRRSMFMLTRV
jgi:23S rRNA (guanine2535-N1)-methyltransferase